MMRTRGPKLPQTVAPKASTAQAEADRQARLEREAAALRANLRRRKAQAAARSPAESNSEPTTRKP